MAGENARQLRPALQNALVPDTLTTPAAGTDLGGRILVGVTIPAGLDGTTLGFTVAPTLGGTYNTLMSAGVAVSLTVAASRYVALDPTLFVGVRFVKPVLGAQTGDITLVLHSR
jgi:hypothetical protein